MIHVIHRVTSLHSIHSYINYHNKLIHYISNLILLFFSNHNRLNNLLHFTHYIYNYIYNPYHFFYHRNSFNLQIGLFQHSSSNRLPGLNSGSLLLISGSVAFTSSGSMEKIVNLPASFLESPTKRNNLSSSTCLPAPSALPSTHLLSALLLSSFTTCT